MQRVLARVLISTDARSAEVDIQPESQYICNQSPYHILYVISYGDSEAQRVCEGSIRQPGQVAGDTIYIPY